MKTQPSDRILHTQKAREILAKRRAIEKSKNAPQRELEIEPGSPVLLKNSSPKGESHGRKDILYCPHSEVDVEYVQTPVKCSG